MGIHLLNSFLQSLYNNGSRIINLSELSGKKIVIDTSIYLYRFKSMGALLENIYLMCTIFRYYNIHPLFIFDGKSRKNKELTIQKRKEEKEIARKEYYEIKKMIKTATEDEKELLEDKMNKLRRRFIKITREDIENVKYLLDFYGLSYLDYMFK
jgi:5'-3' exonuclease